MEAENDNEDITEVDEDMYNEVYDSLEMVDIPFETICSRDLEDNHDKLLEWTGFKIVGDNLDRVVKSRYMRINQQNRSLNYFNSYAVKDKINLSSFCDSKTVFETNVDMELLFPSNDIHTKLIHRMAIVVTRILVEEIPTFKLYFEDTVEYHIKHKYSNEMSKKSEVVS